MNQDQLLNTLKDIILDEDRTISKSIKYDLEKLQHKIEDEAEFKKLVHPQLDNYTAHLKTNFIKIYGNEITGAIKQQIRDSKDEVIDALYPIIGKLIQKYIQSEFAKISEKVDSQVNNTLSPQYWINMIKSKVSGTSNSDIVISEMNKAQLEEVYLIDKNSGILEGSYSKNNTLDQDMIAGMLTAIKSFVEDAFTKKSEELSTIEYNNYKIIIFNYHSFYLALVLSGNITHSQKSEIFEWCNEFVAKEMKNVDINSNSDSFTLISNKIKNYFSQK